MTKLPNVTVLDHAVVDLDTDNGQKLFSMYNKSAVENGYEGIMIKDLNAAYECKRSTAWLKLKPFIEVSLEVIEIEEGTGRNVGRLGAFVCSGNDDGKRIKVNVGSGFSDSNRDSFWASHVENDNIVGQIVEVRADAVTQNQDGSYSLRFPRFLRFRGFEAGEKL
jgi:DNA ligase-1